MNRREFILRLEQALRDMPEEERRRAVEYYENYFDEAGPENEQEVLHNLGAPEKAAADILRDYQDMAEPSRQDTGDRKQRNGTKITDHTHRMRDNFQTMDNGQKLLLIVLAIFAIVIIAPVCVGIVGGIGGIFIGLICVIFAIFLVVPALDLVAWVCAITFAILAGATVVSNPPTALLSLGIALICAALGILLWRLTVYLFCTTFPALIRGIANFFRGILHF